MTDTVFTQLANDCSQDTAWTWFKAFCASEQFFHLDDDAKNIGYTYMQDWVCTFTKEQANILNANIQRCCETHGIDAMWNYVGTLMDKGEL
jgi:hypothetical protein